MIWVKSKLQQNCNVDAILGRSFLFGTLTKLDDRASRERASGKKDIPYRHVPHPLYPPDALEHT